MKSIDNRSAFKAPLRHPERVRFRNLNYSTLVVIGALMALVLLTGCKSAAVDGGRPLDHYNASTGYPAVGGPSSTF